MTNEFLFVGENKDDEEQLLVKGADGKYYAYEPERDHLEQVEPDESAWIMDARNPEEVVEPDPVSPTELDLS